MPCPRKRSPNPSPFPWKNPDRGRLCSASRSSAKQEKPISSVNGGRPARRAWKIRSTWPKPRPHPIFSSSPLSPLWASRPDWIFITTWNGWWENPHIEPSRLAYPSGATVNFFSVRNAPKCRGENSCCGNADVASVIPDRPGNGRQKQHARRGRACGRRRNLAFCRKRGSGKPPNSKSESKSEAGDSRATLSMSRFFAYKQINSVIFLPAGKIIGGGP